MNNLILLISIFLLNVTDLFSNDSEILLQSKIQKVYVFLEGAQVFRSTSVPLNKGQHTIRFKSLSPYIESNSIQVKVNNNVSILSIKYERNYLNKLSNNGQIDSLNKIIKRNKDSIEIYNIKIAIITQDIEYIKQHFKLNDKATASDIKDMAKYYSQRMEELKMNEVKLNHSIVHSQNIINDISNQISNLGSAKEVPSGEIIIEIDVKSSGQYNIDINYYSKQASWLPSYDIRALNTSSPLDISYKAIIKQDTREDWQNVKLILSSESPIKEKSGVKLIPYYLNYGTYPPQYQKQNNIAIGIVTDGNGEPLIGASVVLEGTTIGTITNVDGRFELPVINYNQKIKVSYLGFNDKILQVSSSYINVVLTESPSLLDEVVVVGLGEIKNITAGATGKYKKENRDDRSQETETYIDGIRTSSAQFTQQIAGYEYKIEDLFTLKSGEKNREIDIRSYDVPSTFIFSATPKISKNVYINAIITDWENEGLIDGQANIYYEDTYIGKTILSLNDDLDSLIISLGIDANIKVTREKDKESSKKPFLSGKKTELKFYNMVVKNYKSEAINLEILDQIPVSKNEEIEVEFKNESKSLYTKETGLLKWMINLEAKSEHKINFGYKVKYPADRQIYIE